MRPTQRLLSLIHVILAIAAGVLAFGAGRGELSGYAVVILVFLAVALAVWLGTRWVAVPGCSLMALAAGFTFLVTVGNIGWPESDILRFALSGLGMLLLEGWTVLYVWLRVTSSARPVGQGQPPAA